MTARSIAIVGGGPIGLSAALAAAHHGIDVVVLDVLLQAAIVVARGLVVALAVLLAFAALHLLLLLAGFPLALDPLRGVLSQPAIDAVSGLSFLTHFRATMEKDQ